MKQPPELDGPHLLRQGDQERCAVEGRRIDGSGVCTVVAIRDWERRGWVLYPHGVAGFGVLIAYDDPDPRAKVMARRVVLTNAGNDRYDHLRQSALRMPSAQFIALCRRFVDGDSDPVGGTAPLD